MGLFDRYDWDKDQQRKTHSNRNSMPPESERSDTTAAQIRARLSEVEVADEATQSPRR
jgi:hypothetical protein